MFFFDDDSKRQRPLRRVAGSAGAEAGRTPRRKSRRAQSPKFRDAKGERESRQQCVCGSFMKFGALKCPRCKREFGK